MFSKQLVSFMPGTRDQFLALPTSLCRPISPLSYWEDAIEHAQVIFIDPD